MKNGNIAKEIPVKYTKRVKILHFCERISTRDRYFLIERAKFKIGKEKKKNIFKDIWEISIVEK